MDRDGVRAFLDAVASVLSERVHHPVYGKPTRIQVDLAKEEPAGSIRVTFEDRAGQKIAGMREFLPAEMEKLMGGDVDVEGFSTRLAYRFSQIDPPFQNMLGLPPREYAERAREILQQVGVDLVERVEHPVHGKLAKVDVQVNENSGWGQIEAWYSIKPNLFSVIPINSSHVQQAVRYDHERERLTRSIARSLEEYDKRRH